MPEHPCRFAGQGSEAALGRPLLFWVWLGLDKRPEEATMYPPIEDEREFEAGSDA